MYTLVVMLIASLMVAPAPEVTFKAYVTGYSYYDNTPPGSADISHPVIHNKAGGTGTYSNPITVAVGHSLATGKDVLDFRKGTKFYSPGLHRYFIVEDTCGDGPRPERGACHKGFPDGATAWLDVWVGGKGSSEAFVNKCMSDITTIRKIIKNPHPNHLVHPGPIVQNGRCVK